MNQIKNLMPSVALIFVLSIQIGNLRGASVVFIVDPAQSQVTLSGNIEAFDRELSGPITAQDPGSLTASYAGTINAEVDETTIQFTGSSLIEAQTNASPQQPAVGGSAGSGPADYGGTAQDQSFFGITVETALRNVALDLTSPMLTLTNGTFASTSLEFLFSSNVVGSIDYNSPVLNEAGDAPLTGDSTDTSGTTASLTTTGNVRVLSIPVNATFTDTSGTLDGTTLNMVGQIVATQTVLPPPIINSITVINQTVVLNVANATTQSEVFTSRDLKTWSTQPAGVTTNLSDQIIFTFPVSEGSGFFRVKQ